MKGVEITFKSNSSTQSVKRFCWISLFFNWTRLFTRMLHSASLKYRYRFFWNMVSTSLLLWYRKRRGSATVQSINYIKKYQSWSNLFKKTASVFGNFLGLKIRGRGAKNGLRRGRNLSYFLSQMGLEKAACPLISTKIPVQKWLNPVKFGQSASNRYIRKNTGNPRISGVL